MNTNNYLIKKYVLLKKLAWAKKTILIITLLISTLSFTQTKQYITYTVTDNETIISIAKKLSVTPYDILKLNPDAKNGINIDEILIVPNTNYKPEAIVTTTNHLSYKDSIKDGVLYHKVKFGETIYSLSRKYKVKKKKVLKYNKLKKRAKIAIGQVLKFPTKKQNTIAQVIKPVVVKPVVTKYITYTVKANDTKYSLAKNNNITVAELENINPNIKGKTLNEYDVISLPNKEYVNNNNIIVQPTIVSQYSTHTIKAKETFYALTKMYQTTKAELIKLNPELVNGLKEGMLIKIPSTISNHKIVPVQQIHLVKPKETIYKITRQYNVTKAELVSLNPALLQGLKVGMHLKLPTKIVVNEQLLNLDSNFTGKNIEIAFMLPFKAAEKANAQIENDKSLNRITDFYLGAKMALDHLKRKGISINAKVFDTKGSTTTVAQILASNSFYNTNAIIGPMYFRNVEQVARSLTNNKTIVVSPVASNNHSVLGANNIIQNMATKKDMQFKILDFIKQNYTNQNIVIIADDLTKKSKYNVTEIVNYLKTNTAIKNITVLRLEEGYIKKELFEEKITDKKENWVILASSNKATTSVAVDNLGPLSKTNFNVTLFGLNRGKNFKGIKNAFLNRLNFHYPTNTFIDANNYKVETFKQNYKAIYGAYPSDFVYKGYDTTYDAIIRIATYKNLNDSYQLGKTKGLASQFNYTNNSAGYVNKGIFIIKYQDYQLIKVE